MEKPNCLYPYLILVDDIPAGFVFIATPPYCSQGVDYFVNEFFLMQPFRGQGIAEHAATNVLEKFKGNWELFTNPADKNVIGQKFWRKTVSSYTKGNFEEVLGPTHDGNKLIFRFSNT